MPYQDILNYLAAGIKDRFLYILILEICYIYGTRANIVICPTFEENICSYLAESLVIRK
jgi:hypothetical protein